MFEFWDSLFIFDCLWVTLQYREAQNRIIIIIMNFIGMKYLQFMAKVDYMNRTEQNKITINMHKYMNRMIYCG